MWCRYIENYYSEWYKAVHMGETMCDWCFREAAIRLHPSPVKTVSGTRWGYIDNRGNFIIKPIYDFAHSFQPNGLAVVEKNNLQGLINAFGNYVVQPKYQNISQFSDGRAVVIVPGKGEFKIIDERGQEVTERAYDIIGSFKQGRAIFANINPQGDFIYGYLDRQGEVAIPAKYKRATDFKNGRAIVQTKDNEFQLITPSGEVLNTYNYYFVGEPGEGLLAYQASSDGKYGYIDEKGNIIIEPKYTGAEAFNGGYAVVNISEDYTNKFGLIDRKGNFVIEPKYNAVDILGENRISVGKTSDESKSFMPKKYALADTTGKLLTGFIFDDIFQFKNGLASASGSKYTFFINTDGSLVRELPVVSGEGTLTFEGDLISAFVDNRISYYNTASKLVWKQNTIIPLNSSYSIEEVKYKPNKDYLVYYPQVRSLTNTAAKQKINNKLKELAQIKYIDPNAQLDHSYVGDFSIEYLKKDLVVIELDAYDYHFGAAHGMPTKVHANTNLSTGNIYELKDLFKMNSNYVKVLSGIVGEQIKNNPEYSYVFPGAYKGISANQPFYVDGSNLYLYFAPYEIGPFAAGFPTFKIPFSSIMNIIDTNGELWKAFN